MKVLIMNKRLSLWRPTPDLKMRCAYFREEKGVYTKNAKCLVQTNDRSTVPTLPSILGVGLCPVPTKQAATKIGRLPVLQAEAPRLVNSPVVPALGKHHLEEPEMAVSTPSSFLYLVWDFTRVFIPVRNLLTLNIANGHNGPFRHEPLATIILDKLSETRCHPNSLNDINITLSQTHLRDQFSEQKKEALIQLISNEITLVHQVDAMIQQLFFGCESDLVTQLSHNPLLIWVKDGYCRTLLHEAVSNDRLDMTTQLIVFRADINATDALGRTPLHIAALTQPVDMNLVTYLMTSGAAIDKVDHFGNTMASYLSCHSNQGYSTSIS